MQKKQVAKIDIATSGGIKNALVAWSVERKAHKTTTDHCEIVSTHFYALQKIW
jgi:hypothetical protein